MSNYVICNIEMQNHNRYEKTIITCVPIQSIEFLEYIVFKYKSGLKSLSYLPTK